MSEDPSPFMSPSPTMLQGGPTKAAPPFLPSTVPRCTFFFDVTAPIEVFLLYLLCALPFAFMSLVPTMFQGGPTNAAAPFSPTTVPRRTTRSAFMNQIWVSLVELLCHTMSCVPLVSMSPIAAMRHGGPTKAGAPFSPSTVPRPTTRSAFINQIWVSLVELLSH